MESNIKWREHPGCFELHLQRRFSNVLFPSSRRQVSKEEIENARKLDDKDMELFYKKYMVVVKWLKNTNEDNSSVKIVSDVYRNVEDIIDEAYTIGGDYSKEISLLREVAKRLRMAVSNKVPELEQSFLNYYSVSEVRRIGWVGQLARPDSPISNEDEIPGLLSENLETIRRTAGFLATSMDTNEYRDRIIATLETAYREGFQISHGKKLLDVFDSGVNEAKSFKSSTQ